MPFIRFNSNTQTHTLTVRAYTWQRIRASANASKLVLVAVTNGVLVPLLSDDSAGVVDAVFDMAFSSIAKNILYALWRVRAVEFVSEKKHWLKHTHTSACIKKNPIHIYRDNRIVDLYVT